MHFIFNLGCLATLIRQTNIVWVAYVAFEKLLDVIESKGKRPARSAKTKVTVGIFKNKIHYFSLNIKFIQNYF